MPHLQVRCAWWNSKGHFSLARLSQQHLSLGQTLSSSQHLFQLLKPRHRLILDVRKQPDSTLTRHLSSETRLSGCLEKLVIPHTIFANWHFCSYVKHMRTHTYTHTQYLSDQHKLQNGLKLFCYQYNVHHLIHVVQSSSKDISIDTRPLVTSLRMTDPLWVPQ